MKIPKLQVTHLSSFESLEVTGSKTYVPAIWSTLNTFSLSLDLASNPHHSLQKYVRKFPGKYGDS